MRKINKKFGMIIGTVGLLVMMSLFLSAFGASTAYWDERPLKLAPGESKTVSLGLQNAGGATENITLRAELTNDGGGIATLVDEILDYFVPVGGGAAVPIRVEIPQDAEIGVTYQITVSFTQVSSGQGGEMVTLAGGIVSKFPVEIVSYEESVKRTETPPVQAAPSSPILTWIVIVLGIVILGVVYLIFKNMKKGRKLKK